MSAYWPRFRLALPEDLKPKLHHEARNSATRLVCVSIAEKAKAAAAANRDDLLTHQPASTGEGLWPNHHDLFTVVKTPFLDAEFATATYPDDLHTALQFWPSLAAVIFTLASGATNLIYSIGKGIDLPTSIVWGAVAIAVSTGLALAPSACLLSLSARRYTAAAVSLVALVVFGAYSVTAALGSASGSRMVAQTEAAEIVTTRTRYQSSYETAKSELDQLPPARPAAELNSEIDGLLRTPGADDCKEINGKVTRSVCPQVDTLRTEEARAVRREKLQGDMASAASELAKLPHFRVVNTDAEALAGYLAAAGHPLSTDALNRLLVVLAVLVIEFGGGLSLALAMTLRGDGTEVSGPAVAEDVKGPQPVKVSAPAQTPVAPAKRVSASKVKKRRKRTRRNDKNSRGGSGSGGHRMPANVIDLLKAQGGRIEGGQRGIGKLLGLGKSRANELLHELAASGAVILATSKRGSSVQLVA